MRGKRNGNAAVEGMTRLIVAQPTGTSKFIANRKRFCAYQARGDS